MNVNPSDIEVFEDGDLGIEAAAKAGMIVTNVRSWYDSNYVKAETTPYLDILTN
jgi:beta-phosphoglucomutase-like phosphatase (HAD superfamily)